MDSNPRKRKIPLLPIADTFLASTMLTLAVCAVAAVCIRSLDSLLLIAGEEDFAAIFRQLETADLDIHVLIPFFAALIFVIALHCRRGKGALTLVGVILLGLLLFCVALAAAVWLADVNGIRFGTVIASLLDMIAAGAL